MIDSSTGEANTHMYWTGFTLITCKNSIAGPIVNTQSVVVLVWIILGVSIKPGLLRYTGILVWTYRYTVPRAPYRSIPIYRYIVTPLAFSNDQLIPSPGLLLQCQDERISMDQTRECQDHYSGRSGADGRAGRGWRHPGCTHGYRDHHHCSTGGSGSRYSSPAYSLFGDFVLDLIAN